MKEIIQMAAFWPDNLVVEGKFVRKADKKLTPQEEAKVANKLPKAEQLEHFEEDLEEHDPGNQPS